MSAPIPEFLVHAHKADTPHMTDIERERHIYAPRRLTVEDREMEYALEVDGEKLRAMTGRDHGPHFLQELAKEITQAPLQAIKERMRVLSYGDMITMAEGIGGDPAKLWKWANE